MTHDRLDMKSPFARKHPERTSHSTRVYTRITTESESTEGWKTAKEKMRELPRLPAFRRWQVSPIVARVTRILPLISFFRPPAASAFNVKS
jgi:hypothetical protein